MTTEISKIKHEIEDLGFLISKQNERIGEIEKALAILADLKERVEFLECYETARSKVWRYGVRRKCFGSNKEYFADKLDALKLARATLGKLEYYDEKRQVRVVRDASPLIDEFEEI